MANKIQLRRDTAANWTSTNPVLAQGEVGYDLTSGKMKVGNGTSTWTQLAYFNDGSFSGSYADLTNKPTIPADVSDLTDTEGLLGSVLTTQAQNGSSTGAADGVNVSSSPNQNWTSTTGITVGDMTFDIAVAQDGVAVITVVNGGTNHTVGQTGTIAGTVLGGATPADDLAYEITTILPTPVAVPLNKQVVKLGDGDFTLADGVEGQVIRLVMQSGVTTPSSIWVRVANGRINNSEYQNVWFAPFNSSNNIATLLFTDGAWQADSGLWD